MKKLLLLLIIPFLSFGQLKQTEVLYLNIKKDCGNKPATNKFVHNKFIIISPNSPEYKAYEEDLKIWKECQKINASYLEKELITYFDENNNEPIEGIWMMYLDDGTKYSKVGIQKSGVRPNIYYTSYLIESYFDPLGTELTGSTQALDKQSSTMFEIRHSQNMVNTCILKSNILLEISFGDTPIAFGEKVYPK